MLLSVFFGEKKTFLFVFELTLRLRKISIYSHESQLHHFSNLPWPCVQISAGYSEASVQRFAFIYLFKALRSTNRMLFIDRCHQCVTGWLHRHT